ncbi:RNB domain-containing ribonuclease [Corynebacterium tapiri]|uniref:RNB domain-containing ribonuclease n=1 Tax=Corynebacterium tapiri TaxID=1448266 RepID=A0A5C4U5T1_9CORY|nr:RNB domain-containing ribonuclease [Corynebacterium tapiri]TNL98736.1 RNB domain-containing ribonuclease [Corynebacterium tapiri]
MKLYAADLDFRAIAEEFSVPTTFPEPVLQEAEASTDRCADQRRDARELELVTIDPPGSKDLDQAVLIEARGEGFRVYYAIADVAAWVEPGGQVEAESLRRGQTIYLPDEPARLHPPVISEDRASLLEGVDRPAVLWTIDLDSAGEVTGFHVERALVRSRARLDYDGVQRDREQGTVHPSIQLLDKVGAARAATALRREAINLRLPSQRVSRTDDGRFELVIEPRHQVMDDNSEISLLTGMVAGQMMTEAGHGLVRTLKPATQDALADFRLKAQALGYALQEGESVPALLQRVDATQPRGMAVMREAQSLLRGSGYARVGTEEATVHAGVGGYYAHVTAPLRRLIDRFATEHCLSIAAGTDVPAWVTDKEQEVLEAMQSSGGLASQVDRAVLDLTEATVLAPWVGHNFPAVVLSANQEQATSRIFVEEPPVISSCVGAPPVGAATVVSLITADPGSRKVEFAWPAD